MTRTRAPKGRHRDHADRRAVIDVLLARLARGIPFTAAEAAMFAEQVREEQRLADENRKAMAGTTQALERHREAAAEVIRELEQRAEQAEQQLDEQRQALATALRVREGHEWPALIDWAAQAHEWATRAAVKADRKRAEQAEERAGRFEAAWQSARQRATEQRTLAQIRSSRLRSRAERIAALEQRAHAECQRADTLARQLAEAEQRLARMADNRTGWMQRAQDETHRADRYRTAWYACRRDRKADRAAMAADLPLIAVAPPPRAPEVITDRAAIRAALDESCPDDCPCRAVCIAARP
ncbi:hypothetical protein NGM36_13180 [Streptomyces mutabilis]|uniref:hypothetical protein n=1 Tax=Streptomyces mutabilis TaxID=67332 RepID=UPI0022BA162B|nr:hypothetical protein [Streptomyces mutabilis]MCZ9350740.1 hypothetical protein [Streptomyces mutabilis]